MIVNRWFRKLTFGIVLLMAGIAMGQNITVTGTVTDDFGPAGDAEVASQATGESVYTDADGMFSIDVPSDDTLTITTFDGATQTVAVNGRNTIDVAVSGEVQLNEVVAIGYGSVRKEDATGAVDVLSTEDFNQGVITSPDQLIQGRSAGVQVTLASGEPGAAANIRIRGAASIRAGNDPLYVIDGVPYSAASNTGGSDVAGVGTTSAQNPLNFINSADIESISILKDASATAIYGSRAANGVVLVKTKSGGKGGHKFSLNSSASWSRITNELDLLGATAYRAANPTQDFGSNVNAFGAIFRNAISFDNNFTWLYGRDRTSFRLSVGAQNQEGILKNTGLDKHTVNGTFEQKLLADDRITLSANFTYSNILNQRTANSESIGAEGNILTSALKWNPTRALVDANGYVQPSDNQRNPLAFLDYFSDDSELNKIFGNLTGKLKIIEGLDYSFTFGFDHTNATRGIGMSRLLGINEAFNRGLGNRQDSRFWNRLFTNTINFNRDIFDDVNLQVTLGHSFEDFTGSGTVRTGRDFGGNDQESYVTNIERAQTFLPNENYSFEFNPGTRTVGFQPYSLQSFFGRTIVNLSDKYLFTGTLRVDGSSRFGGNNKYGLFPAGAFAWKIHEENFAPDFFNELKFRAGFGLTGNQEFDATASRDVFGIVEGGLTRVNFANPDLRWESTTQYNVGLDFKFANRVVSGSVDYFRKTTNDLLFRLPVDQPGPQGSFTWSNFDDEIQSYGFELGLNFDVIRNENFDLSFGGNIAILQNEINGTDAFSGDNGVITGFASGQGLSGENLQFLFDNQPLYAFYLPVFTGFNNAGIAQYADINGDGVVNTNFDTPGGGTSDRTFVGDPNPDLTMGMYIRAGYKNWDLSVNGYGAYGHQIYNNTANALFSAAALARGENVTADVIGNGEDPSSSPIISTRYLESGDFFRLSNATIGYTMGSDILGGKDGKTMFRSVRLFLTGANLFVITPYSGFDPEVNTNKSVGGVQSFGIDYSAYPRARTFTFGVNVNF